MNIRSEFANAAQLFALLCLLFWSLTWNSSSNMEYTRYSAYKHETRVSSKDPNLAKPDKLRLTYQHYYFIKSLAAAQYVSERSSDACLETNSILPTFNEWKEMEKKKQDAVSLNKKAAKNQRNASSRKLNFSSSKCGAKILASNPEAKHKTAILNEKADEYLLNPCKVRTWFVIELCDTVEATQIELANYELYSSSPKKFYVFWSDVYPTMWHLLGSFEAKDRRTMQTFDLNAKNLGKFIKVVIYSHHGKEHYCPLSVIRVLGYSMVQDFEDKENVNNFREQKVIFNPTSHNENDVVFNKTSFEVSPENKNPFYKDSSFPDFDPSHICSLFIYCNNLSIKNKDFSGKLCVDKPICRFLNTVTANFDELCKTNICDKHSYIEKLSNKEGIHKNISSITNVTEKVPSDEGQTEKRSRLPQSKILTNVYKNNSSLRNSKNDFIISSVINKPYDLKSSMKYSNKYMNSVNFSNSTMLKNSPTYRNNTVFLREENMSSKCICNPKDVERQNHHSTRVLNGKEIEQELAEMEDSVDSAGLIQKESVLIRLKSRIKSSEIELNLINKYLQQLSQSYRHHMESMQVLFNQTVNAINIASRKSELIDNNQRESMNTLENKVHSLNWKIEHLTNGQKDLIKQIVELHGFFLVLEIIIISTIFTIFLNVYQRRNITFRTRNRHLWKMVA